MSIALKKDRSPACTSRFRLIQNFSIYTVPIMDPNPPYDNNPPPAYPNNPPPPEPEILYSQHPVNASHNSHHE